MNIYCICMYMVWLWNKHLDICCKYSSVLVTLKILWKVRYLTSGRVSSSSPTEVHKYAGKIDSSPQTILEAVRYLHLGTSRSSDHNKRRTYLGNHWYHPRYQITFTWWRSILFPKEIDLNSPISLEVRRTSAASFEKEQWRHQKLLTSVLS